MFVFFLTQWPQWPLGEDVFFVRLLEQILVATKLLKITLNGVVGRGTEDCFGLLKGLSGIVMLFLFLKQILVGFSPLNR